MDVEGFLRFARCHQEPHYTQYASLEAREKSFKEMNWSHQLRPTPKELAEAGFFYSGYTDGTICFHCGKALFQWLATDNPFVEHVLLAPKCKFLEVSKGQDFVKDIKKMIKDGFKKKPETTTPLSDEDTVIEITSGKECTVCTIEERQIVFQPCGHFATCCTCSFTLNKCCICRRNIIHRIRVYSP